MKKVLLLVFVVCLWQMGFGQSGQWTWMKGDSIANNKKEYGVQGISSPSNNPCGRIGCASWTDISGNFWLFGGIDSTGNYLNDLWKYNVVINEWTWIKGTNLTNSMCIMGI